MRPSHSHCTLPSLTSRPQAPPTEMPRQTNNLNKSLRQAMQARPVILPQSHRGEAPDAHVKAANDPQSAIVTTNKISECLRVSVKDGDGTPPSWDVDDEVSYHHSLGITSAN